MILNLRDGVIVLVKMPADDLDTALRSFAPKADWVVVAGSGEWSGFAWAGGSGPGDEAAAVQSLARLGTPNAIALWPNHWDEGFVVVTYVNGVVSSEQETLEPLEVARELGIEITCRV